MIYKVGCSNPKTDLEISKFLTLHMILMLIILHLH